MPGQIALNDPSRMGGGERIRDLGILHRAFQWQAAAGIRLLQPCGR
jgi:hypothetical protein